MEEKEIKVAPGLSVIILDFLLLILGGCIMAFGIRINTDIVSTTGTITIIVGIAILVFWLLITCGFFIIQPNQAAALVLFGEYKGTVKKSGWYWANPFYSHKKISLRSHNLNGEKLKVNDEI